ncbi:MAG: DUF3187 family protein [Gammaproteobacteria bacterium]|nr:MAG: DUF3187 family protein [Gammaproteobacteria bacterium]
MPEKNPVRSLSRGVFYGLLFFTVTAEAQQVSPLLTRDQNPLVMIHGLPSATPARLMTDDDSRFMTSLNISNTINLQLSNHEYLFVDAETYQLNLIYEHGLAQGWLFRIQLPLIGHSGGFLDSAIDNYHDLMGFREGVRPLYPRDQLRIQYIVNGITLLDLEQRSSGIGDVSVQLAWQQVSNNDFALSYWSSIKLATGDSEQLTGSGGKDFALWLASHGRMSENSWLYGNLGYLWLEEGDVLTEQQKNSTAFAVLGLQYQAWPSIQLKAQFDAHTALYDSELDFLGDVIQFTFGGSILFQQSSLDIAIAEDIDVGTSPDVNFNFTFHMMF